MDGPRRGLIKTLLPWLQTHTIPQQSLIVAYSGGRDSHVLLHALWQLQSTQHFKLGAVHVNHNLQPDALKWETHCKNICESYGIPFRALSLQLSIKSGQSLEEVARLARYDAIAEIMTENDLLLTAHSQDDQAETFMLQLIRGAGLKGLAGISKIKTLGKGALARPLLEVSRACITEYAKKHQLAFVEDTSNSNLRFRRNFLRSKVFPELEKVNPSVADCIARSAKHCQQANALLTEYIKEEVAHCIGDNKATLKVDALLMLGPLKQEYVLRHWLSSQQVRLPSTRKFQELLQQMLYAKEDAVPCISWGLWQVRRHQNCLYLCENKTLPILEPVTWHLHEKMVLNDGSSWQATLTFGKGIKKSKLEAKQLNIAPRKGGERCRLQGHKNSRPLKKILQERGLPVWLRNNIPLFYADQELVGVGSLFICEGWQVEHPEEEGWLIENT